MTTDAYSLGFLQQTPPLLHLLLVLAVEPLHNLLIKLHVTLDEFSFFFLDDSYLSLTLNVVLHGAELLC